MSLYYRHLRLAFALDKSAQNRELGPLYQKRAAEFEQSLVANTDEPLRQMHKKILLAIAETQPTPGGNDWVEKTNPWKFSRLDKQVHLENQIVLFKRAVKERLYLGDALNPELRKEIATAMVRTSGWQQHKDLLASVGMLQEMAVVAQAPADEYTLLVDRVFSGMWLPSDARFFWSHTKKDKARLILLIRDYIVTEFAAQAWQANQMMGGLFKNMSTIDRVIEEAWIMADEIRPQWLRFLEGRNRVLGFLKEVNYDDGQDPQIAKLVTDLQGAVRNIKVASTYVHMLMISYYVAKLRFKKTFFYFGKVFILDYTTIVRNVFNQTWPPWFDYGHDMESTFNHFELLDVFQMALRTHAFAAFSVSPVEMLRYIADTLMNSEAKENRAQLIELRGRFSTAGRWPEILRLCLTLQENRKDQFLLPIENLARSTIAANVFDSLKGQENGGSGGTTKGAYLYAPTLLNRMERIRALHLPYVYYFEKMLQIYEAYDQGTQGDRGALQQQTSSLHELLANQRADSLGIFAEVLRVQSDFDRCYDTILEYDHKVAMKIIEIEAARLRRVHDDMAELRKSPERLPELQDKYQVHWSSVEGFDQIDANVYKYSKFDLYARVGIYLAQGGEGFPPIDPRFVVRPPNDFTHSPLVTSRDGIDIPFVESADLFVSMALAAVFADGTGENLVRWLEPRRYLSESQSTFSLMQNMLYAMSPVLVKAGILKSPIAPESVVEKTLTVLNRLTVRDDERELFLSSGRIFKEPEGMLPGEELLVDNAYRPLGIFDRPIRQLIGNRMGDWDKSAYSIFDARITDENGLTEREKNKDIYPTDTNFLQHRAQQFAHYCHARKNYILPEVVDLREFMRPDLRQELVEKVQAAVGLKRAIDALAQKSGPTLPVAIKSNGIMISPLISDHLIRAYDGWPTIFNQYSYDMFKDIWPAAGHPSASTAATAADAAD